MVTFYHLCQSVSTFAVQERFQMMSDQIITRIDDMGSRIDDLEHNINDLMSQAGNASNPALSIEKESK